MCDYKTLHRLRLSERHQPTGRTVHRLGTEELPAPASLSIVTLDGAEGYYLLYLGESGAELTDTFHESIAQAMKQAEHEFGVLPKDWSTP